jgi:MYXO-CTERM domain-containing protein
MCSMKRRTTVLAATMACAATAAPATARAQAAAAIGTTPAKIQDRTLQVALMRDGRRTIETISGTYEGPIENFVLVVPVPVAVTKENVSTLLHKEFERIDAFASPRLDELWEHDPCVPNGDDAAAATPSASSPPAAPPAGADAGAAKVESHLITAEYDVSVLSAADSTALDAWMKGQKLVLPEGAEADLAPYAKAGWRFVVAKVDVTKIFFVHNRGMLSPLRIVFDSDDFKLPLRPALMNSPGTQDLVIDILARGQRYEPASYASILADSNVEVNDAAKAQFAPLHEAMLERALARNPRGIVTEFAGPVSVCDTCSPQTPTTAEMLAFGADVIPPPPNGDRTSGFVLTRLHTRYAPGAIVGDLELRPAPPIVGGREMRDPSGDFEKGAHPSDANDFRTRYVVRHPWTGAVACADPHRGVWGGYPGGSKVAPMIAHSIGFVDPTKMELGIFLREDLPDLDLHPTSLPPPAPDKTPAPPAGSSSSAPGTSAAGCGSCGVGSEGSGAVAGGWWWAAAVALVMARRRR